MKLRKRNCKVKMRLIPYGAGWTDLYADFGDGELYFVISNVMGTGFNALVDALYFLNPNNPNQSDDEHSDAQINC